jgi:hypothetical protein
MKDWRAWLIGGFLAIQLLAPLHYYLLRDDKNDERFAWRMFSPTRGLTCDPDFFVDGRDIGKGAPFHEAWWKIAGRGRVVVLEAMGRKLCRDNPDRTVRLKVTCTTIDKKKHVEIDESDVCQFPDL